MAAGGSWEKNYMPGGTTRRGASVQREELVPLPALVRPIRVAIVENYPLVADSLAAVLDREDGIQVVGTAASLADVMSLGPDLAPDVVTLDLHLGDGTGYDAAVAMRRVYPSAKFVFLSRDSSDDAKLAAVHAGASAYLHKSVSAAEVVDTIRSVALGAMLITPPMVAELISHGKERTALRESLSAREIEVLQLMAQGVHMRDIARRLGISYTTVRTHVRSIGAKLGATSMLQSVVIARELDLVS